MKGWKQTTFRIGQEVEKEKRKGKEKRKEGEKRKRDKKFYFRA